MAHRLDQRAPAVERGDEIGERLARLRLQLLGLGDQPRRLEQRHAAGAGELMQRFQRGLAEAPTRRIDDALEFEVVGRVERHLEIGGRVLDLLPLVEARAADHAIGQAERDEAILEGAHLERRAHQDGDLAQGVALPLHLLDVLADDAGFLLVVPAAFDLDLAAKLAVGAERLAEAAFVMRNQARGRAEDVPGRAVIAFEPDDLGAGKVGLEAQDVVHLGAAPAIDRLIVVADAANIAVALREQPQPQILRDVGVLILVHQHIEEALLVFREHVGVLLEQPQIFQQQVAEIGGVQLLQPPLIERVKLARFAVGEGEALPLRHAFRREPPVLPAVDHRGQQPRRPALLVDILGVEQLLQQPDLIVGIEHGERRLQIDQLGMPAQDLDADGVEGAEPRHAFDHAANQLADADLHLARGLVGEGDGENLPRPRPAQAQNMGNARRQHPGLAGAGAGEHEQRAIERLDRLALLGIERVEIARRAQPHGALRRRQLCILWSGERWGLGANLCHELSTISSAGCAEKRGRG